MLRRRYSNDLIEAGCDEAGRGSLSGPVFAAAVIFPPDYKNARIDDSKKINAEKREILRLEIQDSALAWAVASVSNEDIDEINILQASWLAMHRAIDQLKIIPQFLLIDGNKFIPYKNIPFKCIVKGDSKYLSIAAASILAKTARDEFMRSVHDQYPVYNWKNNKGYPTKEHRKAIRNSGISPFHRKSFNLNEQLKLEFKKSQ